MKKIIAFLLAMVMLLSLVACGEGVNESTDEEKTEDKKATEYIIYTDSGRGTMVETSDGEKIDYVQVSNDQFQFGFKCDEINDPFAEREKTVDLFGKEYTIPLRGSYTTDAYYSKNSEIRKHYGEMNYYVALEESKVVYYSDGTLYDFLDYNGLEVEGNCTEEQGKEIADGIVASLYGEDVVEEYRCKTRVLTKGEKQYIIHIWNIFSDMKLIALYSSR